MLCLKMTGRLMRRNRGTNEAGNVFIIILVGIALFAALGLVVSRSVQSSSSTQMSERELVLTASEIAGYGQNLARAVDRVRRRGCSENDVSFNNPVTSGYEHTPPAPDQCQVFSVAGGGMTWRESPVAGTEYQIWGDDAVSGLGEDTRSELILVLPVTGLVALCEIYNQRNDLGTNIVGGNGNEDGNLFAGVYAEESFASISETPGETAACFDSDGGGNYIIYYVLHVR